MKKTTMYTLLISCGLCIGCEKQPDTSIAMTVLIDRTDSLNRYPTSGELIEPLGLDDDPWKEASIRLTRISDLDINPAVEIGLKGESRWSGNGPVRKAKVATFKARIDSALNRIRQDEASDHSIICRTIAKEANKLAVSHAANKILLVYSDLYENSEISLYDPKTLSAIQSDPVRIERQLTKSEPMNQLGGVEVWLIYKPASYDENSRYIAIAKFYKRLLESRHGVVYIGSKY